MIYLDGQYYVELKDHRYRIHPTENIKIGLRNEPKFFRTQYQVQNDTQFLKTKKLLEMKTIN